MLIPMIFRITMILFLFILYSVSCCVSVLLVELPVSDGACDSALVFVFQSVMFYGLPVCHRLPGVSHATQCVTDCPLFHGIPCVSQSSLCVAVCPVCHANGRAEEPRQHHSFFSASAGLVRAARRVCHRTEAKAITNVAEIAIATGRI